MSERWTAELEKELGDLLWRGKGHGIGGLAPIRDEEVLDFARRALRPALSEIQHLRRALAIDEKEIRALRDNNDRLVEGLAAGAQRYAALKDEAAEAADQNGKALIALDDMLRAVTAERNQLAMDLAAMALTARPGATIAMMDAEDNAAGRRRARRKK